MPLSPLQETPRDVPCKTRGQDGFATSFPVGLLHPLQHAGLARRTPVCPSPARNVERQYQSQGRIGTPRKARVSLLTVARRISPWLGDRDVGVSVFPQGMKRVTETIRPDAEDR